MAAVDFEGLKVYQKQMELVDRIWWYFLTVTLAVVGIGGGLGKGGAGFVCLIYFFAAAATCVPLWNSQQQLRVFARLVTGVTLNPFSPGMVVFFLVVVVVLAVLAIIASAWGPFQLVLPWLRS